jgi:hypothetical protein
MNLALVRVLVVAMLGVGVACVGRVDDATGSSSGDRAGTDQPGPGGGNGRAGNGRAGSGMTGPPGSPSPSVQAGTALRPALAGFRCSTGKPLPAAPIRFRRLSHREYDHTLRDLGFTAGDSWTTNFPGDDASSATGGNNDYGNNADQLTVPPALLDAYLDVGKTIADTADMTKLLPCRNPTAAQQAACATDFIGSFGKRAFRRALTDAERARYKALYDARMMVDGDFDGATRLVLRAVLGSPKFLLRSEIGAPAGAGLARLTAAETAAAISYLIWGSIPDAALGASADKGELDTAAGRRAAATRMLADPRAQAQFREFAQGWLQLGKLAAADKDPAIYPGFDDKLRAAMQGETLALADRAFTKGADGLALMLSDTQSVANDALAKVYGLAGSFKSDMRAVTLDGSQRAGVLTHPSLLAINAYRDGSAPVFRGIFVRRQLLCEDVPPPPPNVPNDAKTPRPATTTRERFQAHSSNPACYACHQFIDPIGFGFESYDGIGRFRATDGGKPVDAAGAVTATPATDGTFTGAVALAQRLAASPDVAECTALQMFRFALGRSEVLGAVDAPNADACVLQAIAQRWTTRGSFADLIAAIVESDGFVTRAVNP